jgi:CO/xanthine dehydrogenase Mo-binding subunit
MKAPRRHFPPDALGSYDTQVCEVEVDPETGEV